MRSTGLGFGPFAIALITTLVGAGASAGAGKLLSPKPETPSVVQTLAAQRAEEKKQREQMILLVAAGVFAVFLVASVAR